jgi:hypothetical protein
MISAPTAPLNGRISKVCGAAVAALGVAVAADIFQSPTHGALTGAHVDQTLTLDCVSVQVVRRADWSAGTQVGDFKAIRTGN